MGPNASKVRSQREIARDAIIDLTKAIENAIVESAKLRGPILSTDIVDSSMNQVLEICGAHAKNTATRLRAEIEQDLAPNLLQAAGNPANDDDDDDANVLREILLLEILRAALDSDDSSDSSNSEEEVTRITIADPWDSKADLGKGAFGKVYSAVDQNKFEFAVKEIPRTGIEENALREKMEILGQLSHENIVKYYGCEVDRENLYLYVELMKGSISDEMKTSGSPIPNDKAVNYSRCVLKGLIYLHSRELVHGDIRCTNILLNKAGVPKLTDIGISKMHDRSEEKQRTICWMSPEVVNGSEAGKRSDVWSVGCTVYEMVKEHAPFGGDLPQVFFEVVLPKLIQDLEHKDLVEKDEQLGPLLKAFLLKIFVPMELRPDADEIAQHRWLQ